MDMPAASGQQSALFCDVLLGGVSIPATKLYSCSGVLAAFAGGKEHLLLPSPHSFHAQADYAGQSPIWLAETTATKSSAQRSGVAKPRHPGLLSPASSPLDTASFDLSHSHLRPHLAHPQAKVPH
jgi:hypothetical protein